MHGLGDSSDFVEENVVVPKLDVLSDGQRTNSTSGKSQLFGEEATSIVE
jgi:hypothetical protein